VGGGGVACAVLGLDAGFGLFLVHSETYVYRLF
jgi:hypothetical protein